MQEIIFVLVFFEIPCTPFVSKQIAISGLLTLWLVGLF